MGLNDNGAVTDFGEKIPGGKLDMKKTLLTLVTAAALMAATTPPVLAQAGGGSTGANQPGKAHKGGERHPEIRAAMKHLEMAKDNLQKGSHDFGGHREKALDLTNQALEECKQALQSDKN
jgi:hypothetical protein